MNSPRLVVHAGEVLTRAGVNLQNVAGFDEQRNLNLCTGLEGSGLGTASRAVTLQAGVGVFDLELDGDRELSEKGFTFVEGNLDGGLFEEESAGVTEEVGC